MPVAGPSSRWPLVPHLICISVLHCSFRPYATYCLSVFPVSRIHWPPLSRACVVSCMGWCAFLGWLVLGNLFRCPCSAPLFSAPCPLPPPAPLAPPPPLPVRLPAFSLPARLPARPPPRRPGPCVNSCYGRKGCFSCNSLCLACSCYVFYGALLWRFEWSYSPLLQLVIRSVGGGREPPISTCLTLLTAAVV